MADDEIIRPPDQVSAGGTATPPDQGGIIDALRSRGPAPQAALQNIMTPPMQPNIGLAAGSGMLAGLAGQQGNPYLSGVAQGNKDQFYQQLNMQREQRAQVDSAFRRNKDLLTIYGDVLGNLDEGPARDKVAKDYAGLVGKLSGPLGAGSGGGQVVGDIAQALATKKVSTEQVSQIVAMGGKKINPNLIALQTSVPLAKVQQILKTDPKLLEQLGSDDAAARADKEVKRKLDAATLLEKEAGAKLPIELKRGSPEFVERVVALHRKQNNGQEYTDGTPESRTKANDAALAAIDARKAAEEARKNEDSLNKALQLLGARTATKPASKMTFPQKTKEMKQLEGYDKIMASINELEALRPELKKQGVFSEGDDLYHTTLAASNMALFSASNSAVKRFKILWPAFEIGQVSRGYFDEKAARQKQAFEEQLGLTKHLPTDEAFGDYLAMMKGLVADQMRATIKRYETLGAPDDLLDAARETYAPWSDVPTREKSKGPAASTGPLGAGKATMRWNPQTQSLEPVK
jgi:hypothetical protein